MKKLAAVLALLMMLSAVPTSAATAETVRPLGTSGAVTVGVRGETQMVYTYDGVNWKNGTLTGAMPDSLWWGYWNGTEFLAFATPGQIGPTMRSRDGVSWTLVPMDTKEDFSYLPRDRVDVGEYRFELNEDGELCLIRKGRENGVLLPDVGEQSRKREVGFTDIQAFPVPGGVRVEAFSQDMGHSGEPYVTIYPTSSLEWVLTHLPLYDSGVEEVSRTSNGTVSVRQTRIGWYGSSIQYSNDGQYWSTVKNAPWNGNGAGSITLLPYNGRTFVAQDNYSLRLYASEDGASWKSLEGTFLAVDHRQSFFYLTPTFDADHKLVWTGSEYIASRRTAEGRYGMMGSSGGTWHSEYCTKVVFADKEFNRTQEYDFGRQVVRVGYANGVYYAEVVETAELNNGAWGEGYADDKTVIYKSTDKKNWAETDLRAAFDSLMSAG